jgi:class 3 adenylate cyclase
MTGPRLGADSSPRVLPRRELLLRVGSIGLSFAAGSVLLITAPPGVALQTWYVLAVPMLLGAALYGRRGAAIMTGATMAVLLFIHASDPVALFPRALVGMTILAAATFFLGSSVDGKEHLLRIQQRMLTQLRRYFSPQLMEYITAQDRPETGSPVVTVRKELTVLFADLRNFTPLAEKAEPEEVVDLLNQFLDAMTAEVFREGGTLDKYVGDGLMAFFGDPGWYPDHADRAFRSALRMQARMRELHLAWQSRGWATPAMGIGICTGHATVGNIGSPSRIEYTVLGSTVNAASRLSSISGPGEILTTHKTFLRVHHFVQGSLKGPTQLKGFSQPVELVSISGLRPLTQTDPDDENGRLVRIVSAVVDNPAYRTVVLTNPTEAAIGLQLTEEELNRSRDVALLCGHPAFQNVPSGEIAGLFGSASMDEHPAGSAMIQQGEEGDRFYVIVDGDVVVTVRDDRGNDAHVASLSCGDVFGEISLLHNVRKSATVHAITSCRLLVLPRAEFQAFIDQAPVFRERLLAIAHARMNPPRAEAPIPLPVPSVAPVGESSQGDSRAA